MAIVRYDPKTGDYKELSDKQIKEYIMQSLGLDINDPDDNKEYRRQYDVIRKRVKNYNTLVSSTKPVKANEVFYRIQQRKLAGKELTLQQENILSTSSINTGTYAKRLEANPDYYKNAGQMALEKEFSGLLTQYTDGRNKYQDWLNEVVKKQRVDLKTGEILTLQQIKESKLKANKDYVVEEITRQQKVTVKQIKTKLIEIANELHAAQAKAKAANKKVYDKRQFYKD